MNDTLTAPIQSDFRVILIDETRHWTQKLIDICGSISTAYLYDNSVDVYCAELTPSKELTPLYYVIGNEVSDEVYEEVEKCFSGEEVTYMKLNLESDRNEVKQPTCNFEFTNARSQEYKGEFDEIEEACKCNHDF
mgnify:FL=1|jgi:hypothetical protein|tara:strand:- start:506 stop:910 length:405 start_codon:yes stop_codon:yes gene_type:complete